MLLKQIAAQALAAPDQAAVLCGSRRLSYSDLVYEVAHLAGRLHAAGIRSGDYVVLQLPNGIDFVTAFLALIAVGAVAVPLSASTTEDEKSRYLAGHLVSFTLADTPAQQQRGLDTPAAGANHSRLTLDTLPEAGNWSLPPATEGPVLCLYSSGSTGQPKRVELRQRHLFYAQAHVADAIEIDRSDRVFCAVPLHHSFAIGNCLLLPLCNGATLIILEPRPGEGKTGEIPLVLRRREILQLLESTAATILPGIPLIFSLLADTRATPSEKLSVRLCISAGSVLARDVHDRFRQRFGIPVRQLYGSTESNAVALNLAPDTSETWDSVGQPLPGCRIRVGGTDEGVAEGTVAIRSNALCDGYAGQPELSRQSFRDGWFFPGDLGSRDRHGNIRILGRRRPYIITAGYKVDPDEIEAVLMDHADVKEVAVAGVSHPTLGEMVTAHVVIKAHGREDGEQLAVYCRSRLAEHKVPKAFNFVPELPRTPMGKLSTHMLTR
ncbi:MAG: class I adenylate-forming enzyme family protein [Gallionellaceae bacterium]|nr:class I adenylate-forming enzyme family protein [Gallionellaceae bacterium]MDD5365338.1 class I adenylate-forming enzyme family protein [Gallionellaceae bacterium]